MTVSFERLEKKFKYENLKSMKILELNFQIN